MKQPCFTMHHIGINVNNRKEAEETVQLFELLFGQNADTRKKGSPFAGKQIEVVPQGPGEHGHIAFKVEDMEKAISYLESQGIVINRESAKQNESGQIYVIYLKKEIKGFAIQLFHK